MTDAATLTIVFRDDMGGAGAATAPAAPTSTPTSTPTEPTDSSVRQPNAGMAPPPMWTPPIQPAIAPVAPMPGTPPIGQDSASFQNQQPTASLPSGGTKPPPSMGPTSGPGQALASQRALVPLPGNAPEPGSLGQPMSANNSMIVGGLGAIYRLLNDWHSEWLAGAGGATKTTESKNMQQQDGEGIGLGGITKASAVAAGLSAGVTKMISAQNGFANQANSFHAAAIVNRNVLEEQIKLQKLEAQQVGFWSRLVGGGMIGVGGALMLAGVGAPVGVGLIAGGTAMAGSGSAYEAAGEASNDAKLRGMEIQRALMKRMQDISMYNPTLSHQMALNDIAKMQRDMAEANNPRIASRFEQFSNMQRTKEGLEGVLQEAKDEKELKAQQKQVAEAINTMHRDLYEAMKDMTDEQKKYYAMRIQQEKDKQAALSKTPLQEFLDGLTLPGDNLPDKNDAIRKLRDAEVIKPLLDW